MFLVLWEFDVKPGYEDRFEKLYGPSGDWARLFRRDSRYQETRLLRDPSRPACYLTLDFWTSRKSYEEFLSAHSAEYQALDSAGEGFTLKERRIGAYDGIS